MIHRSRVPDVEIPDLSLPDYVLAGAEARGDHPALIDGTRPDGRRLSHAELAAWVRRLAAGFAAAGLGRGDVLAIFSPNTLIYPAVLYGALATGATITTVNSLNTTEEIAGQLLDCGASFLVTVSAFLDRAAPAAEKAGIAQVFLCDTAVGPAPGAGADPRGTAGPGAHGGGGRGAAEGYRSVLELLATDAPAPEPEIDPATDVAVIAYSSGTTGLPKGVMLTHRNMVANIAQVEAVVGMTPADRTIAVLPFFHVYGLTALTSHVLHAGSTAVVLPRFDLEQFLGALETHRVTRVMVAPPIMVALAKHPAVDGYDLSAVTFLGSGAAPLDAAIAEACARRLRTRVVQGYGLSELCISHAVPDVDADPVPGTIGRLLPNTECRLVDPDTGTDVGPGEPGELWMRGPQVMRGYLGRPTESAATVDADGWLHSGDIGRVDSDGNFFIVDRLKELIKYKGHQVAPAELEAVLLTHPAVADAAVIGVRRPDGEEVPKAFVVPAAAARLDEQDVISYVAERVAPYKKVRAVEFVDAVPRSMAGKILRRELRDRELRDRELRDRELGDRELGDRELGDRELGDRELGDPESG